MAITTNATAITFNDATVQTTAFVSSAAVIPVGTVMLFYQAAAPTGWTQVTSQNNKALRVVSGTGGVAGGTTDFTSVFQNQTVSVSISGTTGSTTLSEAQMPSHFHTLTRESAYYGGSQFAVANGYGGPVSSANTDSKGSSNSHNHSFSGSGSGSVTLNVQYIDIILASKN
jgi:hypothetical protein